MNGFLDVIKTARLTMSDDELNEMARMLNEEINTRRERAFTVNKGSMRAGDIVSFIDNSGQRVSGEVKKVKQKKAIVRVGDTNWDVPIGMLSAAR